MSFEEAAEPAYGGGTELFHRAVFRFVAGTPWAVTAVIGPWMRTKARAIKAHPNGAALPDVVVQELCG